MPKWRLAVTVDHLPELSQRPGHALLRSRQKLGGTAGNRLAILTCQIARVGREERDAVQRRRITEQRRIRDQIRNLVEPPLANVFEQ